MSTLIDSFKQIRDDYTPIPFWFWNDYLSEDEITRQMEEMKDKGVDAFVIHPRKGLPKEIEYLSDKYFYYVKYAVSKAKEMNMKVVLYDEAMYPSGSCRGMVVKKNKAFASKGLMMTKVPLEEAGAVLVADLATDQGKRYFYMLPSGGNIRGVHENEDDGEIDAPPSSDLLDPEAVKTYIELTHEKYYAELKEYFGSTIIAFFTDEPCILGRNPREGLIPWSDGIYEEYLAAGGTLEDLPLLFEKQSCDNAANAEGTDKSDISHILDKKERVQRARRIYDEVIYARMSRAYYGQLSKWCTDHGIALTGHPEKSTDIGYLQNYTWPCQDIVWRFVEPEDGHALIGEHTTMGKCSSDSARHRGKHRNGNECFGCCGHRDDPYLFTEEDMRWYLNWLFVRGVNLVYPHAFYYSVRDGRGDERPPEVGLGNPFWPQYRKMSNYIKRMCYLNTAAVNNTEIAVLCKPQELSWQIAKPLFENQIEFNYLEEELLNTSCQVTAGTVNITDYSYKLLIYDDDFEKNMSSETVDILQKYRSQGGKTLCFKDDRELLDTIEKSGLRKLKLKKGSKNIRCTYEIKDNAEYVIVTNEGMEEISDELEIYGKTATSVWDPYGDITFDENITDSGSIKLELSKCESRVIFLS
ncbi:hypothetical protein [Butyrivibrio sp.]|uniref:hypothetical protein n=1 Tax=Butyrivibrio sp. TaxID=28121 RepID=UPI0025C5106F|nr:hypothetical protein [Butyrivibrio sp.]MBQ9305737.1 hypothetical protein [Butyrivibrio sp.]